MKNCNRKFFAALLVFAFCFSLSAMPQNEERAVQNLIDDFFDLRMKLSIIEPTNTDELISKINEFPEKHKSEIDALSDEGKLIIENFIVMERYNYLYEIPHRKNEVRDFLKVQLEKIESFCKENDEKTLSKWIFVTRGDITSCYMGFSSSDVIKYGLTIKPLYQKALDLDANFCYALMNMGQWHYYAPAIAGGGKKKARAYFEKAYNEARTPAEKYYASLFYSQVLFELKEKDKAKSLMEECLSCCPKSKYAALIISANASGKSLYQYNKDKSALTSELEK